MSTGAFRFSGHNQPGPWRRSKSVNDNSSGTEQERKDSEASLQRMRDLVTARLQPKQRRKRSQMKNPRIPFPDFYSCWYPESLTDVPVLGGVSDFLKSHKFGKKIAVSLSIPEKQMGCNLSSAIYRLSTKESPFDQDESYVKSSCLHLDPPTGFDSGLTLKVKLVSTVMERTPSKIVVFKPANDNSPQSAYSWLRLLLTSPQKESFSELLMQITAGHSSVQQLYQVSFDDTPLLDMFEVDTIFMSDDTLREYTTLPRGWHGDDHTPRNYSVLPLDAHSFSWDFKSKDGVNRYGETVVLENAVLFEYDN